MTDGIHVSLNGNRTAEATRQGLLSYDAQKRLFDLVFGALLTIPALPVVLCAAAHIKCVSKGPVFYKQKRIGLGGKEITVLKLRTMKVGTEEKIPGGDFLRSTHFDELPQLWNVFRGDMHLVGPRPRLEKIDHDWFLADGEYGERRRVKPGITGPAFSERSGTPEEMRKIASLEREYIRNWSIGRDLKILFLTIPEVLLAKGA